MGNYTSDQKNAKFYGLKLSRNTDADIIRQLETMKDTEGIQGYLKRLIREDMKKGGATMNYRIKPEYLDNWGATQETVVTEQQIAELASDWEMTVDELMDQVYPDTPAEVAWYNK